MNLYYICQFNYYIHRFKPTNLLVFPIVDRDGEYFSYEFDLFYVKHDIIHERKTPYSAQSTRVVERKNNTLTDFANAI
jgi:hypothetical protein